MNTSRSLWRNPDFLKLWTGETLSLLGSEVTELALPLTAVIILGASPGEMGILGAARFAPFLLVTLFAGVWVDRVRRRPVMMAANLGRALLIGMVPLLALADRLEMSWLYVIAFAFGMLTVFFDVAYQSFLPHVVASDQLVAGNARLQASASVARVSGPGVGGALVAILSAPGALIVDAASYVVSFVTLALIRSPEPQPDRTSTSFVGQALEGLRITYGRVLLRVIAGVAATYNLFEMAVLTLFTVYAIRELGLSPLSLGIVLSIGSIGALLGTVLAGPASARIGVGPALVVAVVIECAAFLLLPLAGGAFLVVVSLLAVAFFLNGFGLGLSNVLAVSLRQVITPEHLLGRMNASYRFLTYGAIPIGALLGGVLGEIVGLRGGIAIAAALLLLTIVWLPFAGLSRLHGMPAQEGATREG